MPQSAPRSWTLWPAVIAVLAIVSTGAAKYVWAAPEPRAREALVLDVRGAIGPAVTDYLRRGFASAAKQEAALVILRIDTPGGLDTSMREIVREILASPVPVASYVSPSGARAASAGTFILYASHLAAMAPGTNLGAATPVQIGGGPSPVRPEPGDPNNTTGGEQKSGTDPRTNKAVNDAVAYIRGLAELRGRNADWAERAVREAASLTAQAALDQQVINLLAEDVSALLARAHGREVRVGQSAIRLSTAGLRVVEQEPGWRTRVLAIITDPSIAYILLLVGIYGLMLDFVTPGAVLPGIVGGISLLVSLFALNLLPINYTGLALLGLGICLMAAEAFVPSFGALGIGGAVAFAAGSLFLFEGDTPDVALPWPVILTTTTISVALLILGLTVGLRAQRRGVVTGDAGLVGATGEVLSWSDGEGDVHVHGERWHARAATSLKPGERVSVTGRDRLTLEVTPEIPHSDPPDQE